MKGDTTGTPKARAPRKKRLMILLPPDLIERVRDIVYWTPGLTLSQFATEAFTKQAKALEKKRGEPFPHRKGELTAGRQVS